MKRAETTKPLVAARGPADGGHETPVEYRYPDFLCIGAQKAGTSWLDKNLRCHPKLWLPPMKELQYFSHLHLPKARRWTTRQRQERGTQLLRRYMEKNEPGDWNYRHIARLADIIAGPITDAWYGRIFALAKPDQICGEVTPDYYILPDEGIAHVVKLSPAVRIVLSLRDPIERSWSHLRMLARTRGLNTDRDLAEFATRADQLVRADYPAVIRRWRAHVPKDRFLVVFMDELVETPDAVMEKVCALLGVAYGDEMFPKASDPVHVGEAQDIPPVILALLKERFRPVYDEIATLYPDEGARWAARYY